MRWSPFKKNTFKKKSQNHCGFETERKVVMKPTRAKSSLPKRVEPLAWPKNKYETKSSNMFCSS